MSYADIPAELKALNQWVVWKYEIPEGETKVTKVPYRPNDGHKKADKTKPAHWASFEEAVTKAKWFDGIGFVFTRNDPYAFIDLDNSEGDESILNRQLKIYEQFGSYAERSPSGKGCHIIVKGNVPQGRKRAKIEVYSSEAYATFTGDVIRNEPINDHDALLNVLWSEMGSPPNTYVYGGDAVEQFSDDEVITRALAAQNGDKFRALLEGKFADHYPSQSEADQAFINMLAFYTQYRPQIARIFRASPLGNRSKAQRDAYLNYTTTKAFDKMLPPVDIDGLRIQVETQLATAKLEPQLNGHVPAASPYSVPPGLVGDIAQFIYEAAPRPVPEAALAAALGFMSGMCGRTYNVSGTGLNQYILYLAATGSGKEAMASGINRLLQPIKMQVPAIDQFIGPGEIASGQALPRYLLKSSVCFVSIVGEFALKLEQLSSQRANSSDISMRKMILDLYNKSGPSEVLRPSIYSDSAKNIDVVGSPSFSILGESTPEGFYEVVNEKMIKEGLLPRFMIFEYQGKRPKLSNTHESAKPSLQLIERVGGLAGMMLTTIKQGLHVPIEYTPEAQTMLRDFNQYIDDKINDAHTEVIRNIWNRAHIKALKLAAIVAVGINTYKPTITIEQAAWAIKIVEYDCNRIHGRFATGDIGKDNEDTKQTQEIRKALTVYCTEPYEKIEMYEVARLMHTDKVFPYAFIQRKCVSLAAFKNDRNGATNAINRTIKTLLDNGDIREVPKTDLAVKYKFGGRAFALVNLAMIKASP